LTKEFGYGLGAMTPRKELIFSVPSGIGVHVAVLKAFAISSRHRFSPLMHLMDAVVTNFTAKWPPKLPHF